VRLPVPCAVLISCVAVGGQAVTVVTSVGGQAITLATSGAGVVTSFAGSEYTIATAAAASATGIVSKGENVVVYLSSVIFSIFFGFIIVLI
jgi:hypothetical protein